MPTTCIIDFEDNPSNVCYSGTVLRGSVSLSLTDSEACRGVYVKIKGDGYVLWSEGSGDKKKTYTGSEKYIDERVYLTGGLSGNIIARMRNR